jgi:predicted Rossmann fold nucleotide-binding protein DprA/Smf involved in DNA uptake
MPVDYQASRTLSLLRVRPAVATQAQLEILQGDFPKFVHKWTQVKRCYKRADLALPDKVYFRGKATKWDAVAGIGGTRSPAVETFCLVAHVVSLIAEQGVTIISGGVPGVDLAAHMAAIDVAAGSTLAVLANPVSEGLQGHEWSNRIVERSILRKGAFISEYGGHADIDGDVYHERLLDRDRIISGLSDVFVAFECNRDSATVDTARRAIAQGKIVVCVKSRKDTNRRGLDQLIDEDGLPFLDEKEGGAEKIASELLARLRFVKSGSKTPLKSVA